MIASVWLQRPGFLVFGALGCYGYASYLAFETFSGSTGFPIALAVIGFLIVLTAVLFQRYVRTWLGARVGRYNVPSQQAA